MARMKANATYYLKKAQEQSKAIMERRERDEAAKADLVRELELKHIQENTIKEQRLY